MSTFPDLSSSFFAVDAYQQLLILYQIVLMPLVPPSIHSSWNSASAFALPIRICPPCNLISMLIRCFTIFCMATRRLLPAPSLYLLLWQAFRAETTFLSYRSMSRRKLPRFWMISAIDSAVPTPLSVQRRLLFSLLLCFRAPPRLCLH